jgi:hypothetical protein
MGRASAAARVDDGVTRRKRARAVDNQAPTICGRRPVVTSRSR